MSDTQVYDPLAIPNPARDHDSAPGRQPTGFERRTLAHTLLDRAHARQEAIADAFIDALLDGQISLFRMLLDLEQAALASQAQAEEARRPTFAEILLPMLDRERKQAAARAAANGEPAPSPYRSPEEIPPPVTFTEDRVYTEHRVRPADQPAPSSPAAPHTDQPSATPGIADLNAASLPSSSADFHPSASGHPGAPATPQSGTTTPAPSRCRSRRRKPQLSHPPARTAVHPGPAPSGKAVVDAVESASYPQKQPGSRPFQRYRPI